MKSYIIQGGKTLNGEVYISGSKNASLPIIAAAILNPNVTRLYNVPKIHDTKITLEILKILGCKIKYNSGKIEINSRNINKREIPEDLMRQMRSTVVLAGAILGRFKEVRFSYPGGCEIGARPIDLHLAAFRKLGINVEEKGGFIYCKCDKIVGANLNLDFPSVGATENIVMAATLAEGTTVLENAAQEPEIVDLCNYLNKMGARIKGAGTDTIKIEGVEKLHSAKHVVIPDRIEAGTYMLAAAITRGVVLIKNMLPDHVKPIIAKLRECGAEIYQTDEGVIVKADEGTLRSTDIKTLPYPGFPTDLQSPFMALLTTVEGQSAVIETVFENRYMHVKELKKMGADITVQDRCAIIRGGAKLKGAKVAATDLRAGAAVVLAGLVAEGVTEVSQIYHIDRGYEDFVEKMTGLGAIIKRVED